MSFHQPFWLLLLLPLPFLAFLRIWSHVSTGRGGRNFVSPRLRSELIVGSSQGLRWAVFCLNLLAIACLIVAIARPQWGTHEAESVSEGRNLIVAIDTSRSMLATDILPDRLTRAKLAAQDIIASLPEDRIGLVAFAGKAFLQAPLTVDHDAILESIDQLDTEIIPRGGTNLEEPVQLALKSFEEAESKESALIIFSDGEDLEGEQTISDLKEKAAELGMIIVAIGVGTEAGSIIPEPDSGGRPQPGVFVKDETGNVVRTRLDPKALQDLSAESGAGVYVNLGSTSSITSLVNKSIESLTATRLDDQARLVPIERFMWPLSAAVFLWVVAFLLPASTRAFVDSRANRNGASIKVPPPLPVRGRSITGWILVGLIAAGISGRAADEPISPAFEALKNSDYETAITQYEAEIPVEESEKKRVWLNLGLGSAAYLEGDYEKAQQSFGKVLAEAGSRNEVEKAHFNLGNSLFRKGQIVMGWDKKKRSGGSEMLQQIVDPGTREEAREQWNSALEHYQAALDLNSSNLKAKKNIEVVNSHLEYLDKIEEEERQQEEQEDKKDEEKQDEEKDEKEDQKDEEEKKDDQQKEDKGDEQKDDKGDEQKEDKGDEQKDDKGDEQKDQGQDEKQDPSQDPQNQDQKPEDQESGDDSTEEQEGEGSEDPDKKEPQDGNPEDSENQDGKPQDGDNQDGKPEEGQNDRKEEKPLTPEEQGPPPEDNPSDGELEANPAQPEKQKPLTPQQAAAQQAAAAARKANPETGYSPSEARQLLRALADENMEVRPIFGPIKADKYKNW